MNLINSLSMENGSDTPDYLLAGYLTACLMNYEKIVKERDKWFGFEPSNRVERIGDVTI